MTDDYTTPRPALTDEEKRAYEHKIEEAVRFSHPYELAYGLLRYEALRRLSPADYLELHKRNLAGENFDAMVDKLVVGLGR